MKVPSLVAFLSLLGVCAASSGQAATLAYNFEGACAFNCEEEGLAVGAKATGTLSMLDDGFTPNGSFGSASLVDFSFDLGGIKVDKQSSAGWSFGGTWGASAQPQPFWELSAGTTSGRFNEGPTISVGGGEGSAFAYGSFLGTCETLDNGCTIAFHTAAQFEMTEAAPVPLPAPLVLLLAGLASLAGLGLAARPLPGRRAAAI